MSRANDPVRFSNVIQLVCKQSVRSVQVRDAKEQGGGDVAPIPVTVRQLEALVRISESLARMELATTVTDRHVTHAIQLFHASTLDAVRSGMSQVRTILGLARAWKWQFVVLWNYQC